MKPFRIVVYLVALFMIQSVRSQDQAKAVSGVSNPVPVAAPATTARIIGTIPDGTPPPPQVPKPQFVARATDILDSKVHQQGGRTITIQEIKPIALPPPPMPQPESPTTQIDTAAFKQRLADYRATHPRTEMLFISALVYRTGISQPRTQVRY